MTGTMNNTEFWLPSEFLNPDDTILLGKENLNRNAMNTSFATKFGSSLLSSPGESVLGSTETESDEDDLLAAFTRHFARSSLTEKAHHNIASTHQNLEKSWVMCGSPQSNGSWSVHSALSSPSPPATPLGGKNDGWDLIYAAEQLARLKMNGEGPLKGRGLLSPPQILTPIQNPSHPVHPNTGFYANQSNYSHTLSQLNQFGNLRQEQVLKQHCSSIWGRQIPSKPQGFQVNGGYERQMGLSESAWLAVQNQRQNHPNQRTWCGGTGMRAVFRGGSGGKRECAGTGVFIPRRHERINHPSECRKRPGCSTALLPASVVQTLNNNFDNMASQSQTQLQFNSAFVPGHADNLMARRNAMLNQQRWSMRPEGGMRRSHDLCLPQDWAY